LPATLWAAAKFLRKSPEVFAKYEGGERRLDVVEFIAICRAIPVDSAAILGKIAKIV
jgi:hypothetical protein